MWQASAVAECSACGFYAAPPLSSPAQLRVGRRCFIENRWKDFNLGPSGYQANFAYPRVLLVESAALANIEINVIKAQFRRTQCHWDTVVI
jgi:hypothetical protein